MNRSEETTSADSPQFYWFLGATLTSAVGRNGYNIACAWLLAVSGDGVSAVAAFFAILSIVELLASPVAGWMVDQYDRRRLSMLSDLLRIMTAPFLGWLIMSGDPDWVIWLSTFLFASCDRLSLTATQSMVPRVGARFSLHTANCLTYFSMQLGSLVAAAVIGVILFISNALAAFVVVGAFFTLSLFSMYLVRHQERDRRLAVDAGGNLRQYSSRLLGIGLIYSTLYVGGLLISAVGPSFVFDELRGNAMDFGHLESVWSAGSILGAVLLIPLARMIKTPKLYLLILIVTALSFAAFNTHEFPLVLVAIGIIGFAYNLGRVAIEVALQASVSHSALGRSKGALHSVAVLFGLISLSAIATVSDVMKPSAIFLVFSGIVVFIAFSLAAMQSFGNLKD
ncbi:MFS transporter [Agrobacterium sp. T29]|uniref:MFS transporter n=1 Tax=Agrobacterium sp. T29 TaxID=2580515 RepID=UPI00115CEF57|nr:MFS transporter [Agrobacterium sp. T29]